MIKGMHPCSSPFRAEAARAFIRDKLGFAYVESASGERRQVRFANQRRRIRARHDFSVTGEVEVMLYEPRHPQP